VLIATHVCWLQDIKCSRGAHNSLSITWLSPVQPGKPPFHKYVLERLPLSAPGSGWEFVADAVDVTRWLDLPPPGVFQYRVVAWNVYGRGPAATSAACAVPPADVGGVEAPAGGCAAGSSDSCRRAALPQLHWNTPASAPGERHTTGPPPQQLQHSSEDGVVATQGLGPGASTQAFGGVHSEQQPGAVTAGATAHTAALHPSDPAGAHPSQVTAGAWRAFVKKAAWWLWTAFNTVLVLVLPACVRLLPVSVLHRAYQLALGVVARTLLFLGRLVRSCKPSAAAAADGANKTAAGGDHKVQAGPRTPTPPALQQAGRHAADIAVPGPEIQPAATVSLNGPGCWEAGGQIRGVVQEPDAQQPHSRAASSSSSHNSDGGALPVPFHERSSTGAPRGAEEVGWLQEGSTSVLPLQPLAPWDGPLSAGSGSAVVRPREGELGEEAGHGALNGQPLVMPSGLSSARVSAGPQRHIRASSSGGRQWAVPAGGLPHSSSGNSLTAGSHSEAGAAGHQQWRAVSMVDNLVADPAAAGVRAQLGTSASAPQLQLLLAPQEAAGIGSHSKKQCAHPGCEQRFDSLRNLGAKRQRHNCGRCLRTVCLAHTAYSTHGTSGPCGVQSRCVCVTCFAQFTPEYQMLLAARNTLCAGGGAAAGGLPCGGRQRRPSSSGGTAARLLGRSPSLGRMQAAGVTEAAMGPAHGESGNAEMRGLIGGLGRGASGLPPAVGGSRGRLMWARTWTKLHAVHQFNRAARSSQQQDSQ
jgi:hypothetical protein